MTSNQKTKVFIGILSVIILLTLIITFIGRAPSENIRLGAVLFLSGEFKSYGEQFRDGARIAVDEINRNAESDDDRVELIIYDSQANIQVARERLQTLRERDKIDYIVEIMGSGIAINTIDYITDNNMLVLSGVNTSPDFTYEGGENFFRIIPSDGVASQQLAEWSSEMGWNRTAIVYSTDVWGTGLKNVLETTLKELGSDILLVKDTEMGQSIFQPVVSDLRRVDPDVVFILLYPREAGLFMREARRQNFKTNFMGTDNLTGDEFRNVGGDAVEGVKFVIPAAERSDSPKYQHFLKMFREKYGDDRDPALFSITGYDCIHLMVETYKSANGDVDKGREYLKNVRFEGASSIIEFDQYHDVIVADYARNIFDRDPERNRIVIKEYEN